MTLRSVEAERRIRMQPCSSTDAWILHRPGDENRRECMRARMTVGRWQKKEHQCLLSSSYPVIMLQFCPCFPTYLIPSLDASHLSAIPSLQLVYIARVMNLSGEDSGICPWDKDLHFFCSSRAISKCATQYGWRLVITYDRLRSPSLL